MGAARELLQRIASVALISSQASTDPERPNFVPTLFACTKLRQSKRLSKGTKTTTTTIRGCAKTRSQAILPEDSVTKRNPTASKEHAKAVNTTTSKEHAKAVNTTTSKEHAKAANPTTLKEHAKAANPTTLKEHAKAANTNPLKEHAKAANPTTLKEHAKAANPTTSKEHAKAANPTTSKEHAKAVNPTTLKEHAKANTSTVAENPVTKNTPTVKEDAGTENKPSLIEDEEMQISPTQPASESPLNHQTFTVMEIGDEFVPEVQSSLSTSASKEEEAEDKKIYNEDQTAPKKIKLENKYILKIPPHYRDILKLDRKPVVLLKPLVPPQDVSQADLNDQTLTEASEKECEEGNMCQTGLTESSLVTKDHSSFPCNMCDRTFSTSHYLKRHKLLHVRDVRKCLRCGALFCRRHNHVLFQTRSEPLPVSEESSSSSEDESLNSDSNTENGQTSETTETADKTLSIQTNAPPSSPAFTNSPVLTVSPLTNTRKPLLESVKPAAVPRPPSPIFKVPNNQATVFQIKPLRLGPSPSLMQPNVQQPQLPSSLKVFSSEHLTSALLDVQRNYEYILGKSKTEVQVKEEPEDPSQICPVEEPVTRVKLEKIAYDLEMVI
ncbi:uncharacterized protein LOC119785034 isoform X2 [Cyprinodon tularosa]|uniref:uncharacterized protein LOC119785034 isoform X2 n=1 Tax=Cyprinodon tularosa TaxID=77115 RepID=UPI0018E1EDC5|nr:uncharacterized protein LOC119785034 isoform X2 [Cyprinodon tularosa]